MARLPSGTVTFCFTDIEGSTQLFAKLGPRFLDVLEEHRQIVRSAVDVHGGVEVHTEGDGFFVAFDDAVRAVAATVDIQRGLHGHPWPEDAAVKVRIGLHTDEAEPVGDDYVSFAVHEAARISASAHGGQIVTSARTAAVAQTDGLTFKDLGEHALKDLQPMRLYQLCHPDLPSEFPPLRSVGGPRGYVPATATTLVGRDDDVADLRARLASSRLVTITGAGGVGKTRLAIEVASAELGSRPDGVWFVDLAPVTDGALVDDAVLDALGVVREAATPSRAQLLAYLRSRDVLLVIDNCEHVVDACSALVSDVLSGAERASVLATSRESLNIDGETSWRARSLDDDAATRLFVERALLVRPDLVVTDEDAAAIARIVERLDGIPLAIELAAARMRVLTAPQVGERLDDRFRLLTGGSRTALARQRTLEATVDWSYALLDDDERTLLRAISVFVGGFDLAAADAVWDGDALDVLERLVDKSMVTTRLAGDRIRYRLLETIRHYSWMKLVDAGEADLVRGRHLDHYTRLVETNAPGLRDARESRSADILRAEHDNMHAALEWAIATDPHSALRLVSELWMYWAVFGLTRDGLAHMVRVLAITTDLDPELRAQAFTGAGHLSYIAQDPNERTAAYAQEALAHIRERGGDARWYDGWAVHLMNIATGASEPDELLHDEAVARARASGDNFVLAQNLSSRAARIVGEQEGAAAMVGALEEALSVAEASGSASCIAYALNDLAAACALLGRLEEGIAFARQAVSIAQRGPNVYFQSFAEHQLGSLMALRGDEGAEAILRAVSDRGRDLGLDFVFGTSEIEIGWIGVWRGDTARARPHFQAAQDVFSTIGPNRPEMLFYLAFARHGLAECDQLDGNLDAARDVFEQHLELAASVSPLRWVQALMHNALGLVALDDGSVADAGARHTQALALVTDCGQDRIRSGQAQAAALRGLSGVALAAGDAARSAFLSGAASHVFEPNDRSGRVSVLRHAEVMRGARDHLGDEAYDAAWVEGVVAGLDGAAALVLR